jgi:hypothetical protein
LFSPFFFIASLVIIIFRESIRNAKVRNWSVKTYVSCVKRK